MSTVATRARILLEQMVCARAFDTAMAARNDHWHESLGEEAVVVGAFHRLRADDVVVPHYRSAAIAALVRGIDPELLALNAYGKAGGTSRGRWRGDVCGPLDATFLGQFSGCLGPPLAYAAGAALTARMQGTDRVVVATFGDGTANAGILWETLNLASMLALPAVYVCQNNQYATSVPAATAIAGGSVAARARSFGVPAVDVDGNDAVAVDAAVAAAVDRARGGGGPSVVHALTYRVAGHWVTDPEAYRTADEVDAWRRRDPITRLARTLIASGSLTQSQLDVLQAEAEARMADAIDRGREAPDPDPADLPRSAFVALEPVEAGR